VPLSDSPCARSDLPVISPHDFKFSRSGDNALTVGAVHLGHSAGRVWFEVEVLEAKGSPKVGFAGTNFCVNHTTFDEEIGSDQVSGGATSWSVSSNGETFHRCFPPPPPPPPILLHMRMHPTSTYEMGIA
jgi:hypothetical protein